MTQNFNRLTANWTTDDWKDYNGDSANWYVVTDGNPNLTRDCPNCGYSGTHYHPRRSAPTFHAELTYNCPDASCGGRF